MIDGVPRCRLACNAYSVCGFSTYLGRASFILSPGTPQAISGGEQTGENSNSLRACGGLRNTIPAQSTHSVSERAKSHDTSDSLWGWGPSG